MVTKPHNVGTTLNGRGQEMCRLDEGGPWQPNPWTLVVCVKENSLVGVAGAVIETTNLPESLRMYGLMGAMPVRFGVRSVMMKWFDGVFELRERSFALPNGNTERMSVSLATPGLK